MKKSIQLKPIVRHFKTNMQKAAATLGRLALVIAACTTSMAVTAETEKEWGYRALKLQNQMDKDLPLSLALFPGTHNAYSNDHDTTLDAAYRNQPDSVYTQLERGVRQMTIDVHINQNSQSNTYGELVLCHNNYNHGDCGSFTYDVGGVSVTAGQYGDYKFNTFLNDIYNYITNNPDVILLIDLDIKDDTGATNPAADAIANSNLGSRVYRTTNYPDGGNCYSSHNAYSTYLNAYQLTKADILAAGKNVIFYLPYEDCKHNEGNGNYNKYIFKGGVAAIDTMHEKNLSNTSKYQDNRIIRSWDGTTKDDNVVITNSSPSMTPNNILRYMTQGLNIVEAYGFNAESGTGWNWDGLRPLQSRDLVWSWDVDYPIDGNPDCAYLQNNHDRFRNALNCTAKRYAACANADGSDWVFTGNKVIFADAETDCVALGDPNYQFAVPRTAKQMQALITARDASIPGTSVWVNYARDPNDPNSWIAAHPYPVSNTIEKTKLPTPSGGKQGCLDTTETGNLLDNGLVKLKWQAGGSLVLYRDGTSIWSTHTGGSGTELCFYNGGKLAINDANGVILFSTGTGIGNGKTLELTQSCNLVIRDSYGDILWDTDTVCSTAEDYDVIIDKDALPTSSGGTSTCLYKDTDAGTLMENDYMLLKWRSNGSLVQYLKNADGTYTYI